MRCLSTLTAAAALLFAATAAQAGDVRPPGGADTSGRGATGAGTQLPGLGNIEAPPIRTTMQEKRKREEKQAVDKDTVKALRQLAIEEFGQSSSSDR